MHANFTRLLAMAAAGLAAVTAFGFTAGASATASGGPGSRLWAVPGGPGSANTIAVSPDGGTVFVTGYADKTSTDADYVTAAYSAATGRRLWAARYNGPGHGLDVARSLAVGRGRVFVTGISDGSATGFGYATVAYSAATGKRLWVQRYDDPAGHGADAAAVAVSPSGRTVFVTGTVDRGHPGEDMATIAYSAETGARLWVTRYNGPANRNDSAAAVAIGPSGSTVYVTGSSRGAGWSYRYATIAYRASTGAQLWSRLYSGPRRTGENHAVGLAAGPGGATVFVTGYSAGAGTEYDYATVAYRAATGARLWVSRYNSPGNGGDFAEAIAVSPGGRRVFVTGNSSASDGPPDYATVAYSAVTGRQVWASRYDGPAGAGDGATAVAVSPGGGQVFVTGRSEGATPAADYATVAYGAAHGGRLWVSRYSGPGTAEAQAIAAGPAAVFVTGSSDGSMTTVAYRR